MCMKIIGEKQGGGCCLDNGCGMEIACYRFGLGNVYTCNVRIWTGV
jgi:hypothetical protein